MQSDPVYNLDKDLLIKILDNTFMNIFVTDNMGKIIFANQGSLEVLGVLREELIGMTSQELVDRKIIDNSITMSALGKREITVGQQKTIKGYNLFVLSRPLFDSDDNIAYIMTNSSPDASMHSFFSTLEKERQNTEKYKNALNYLMEHNGTKNKLIVKSELMCKLLHHMEPAIISDSTIFLYGESGVGKDIIATFIHNSSPRAKEPFIPVNCAAIPQELVESEFFGYESGAFTGASRQGHAGFFEMANHGTLFLDEIGELPLSMQSKFLRVLEDQMVARIGSKKRIHVNIRIIAATNQDLSQMVENKSFREDLYYRLNVIPFTIPPLRDRPDDIIPLAEYFLDNYNLKYDKSKCFSKEVLDALLSQSWRGNVRELKNVIERLTILSFSDIITADDLQFVGFEPSRRESGFRRESLTLPVMHQERLSRPNSPVMQKEPEATSIFESYQTVERDRVLQALIESNGNKTRAAKLLGISRGKLYKLLNI